MFLRHNLLVGIPLKLILTNHQITMCTLKTVLCPLLYSLSQPQASISQGRLLFGTRLIFKFVSWCCWSVLLQWLLASHGGHLPLGISMLIACFFQLSWNRLLSLVFSHLSHCSVQYHHSLGLNATPPLIIPTWLCLLYRISSPAVGFYSHYGYWRELGG